MTASEREKDMIRALRNLAAEISLVRCMGHYAPKMMDKILGLWANVACGALPPEERASHEWCEEES